MIHKFIMPVSCWSSHTTAFDSEPLRLLLLLQRERFFHLRTLSELAQRTCKIWLGAWPGDTALSDKVLSLHVAVRLSSCWSLSTVLARGSNVKCSDGKRYNKTGLRSHGLSYIISLASRSICPTDWLDNGKTPCLHGSKRYDHMVLLGNDIASYQSAWLYDSGRRKIGCAYWSLLNPIRAIITAVGSLCSISIMNYSKASWRLFCLSAGGFVVLVNL